MKKFTLKVNTIANLKTKTNLDNVSKSVVERLEKSATLIVDVLKPISVK
jgi:hypothetical protein